MTSKMHFNFDTIVSSPFWMFSSDIRTICQPLFQQFNLNYFDYSRFYNDNTCISLSSDPLYVNHLTSLNDYCCVAGRKPAGKYLWSQYVDKHFLENIHHSFDYFHGVTYIKQHEDYLEVSNFAASKKQEPILSLYIEGDTIFEYFLSHFLYQISPFLKKNTSRRILMPSNFIGSEFTHHSWTSELNHLINTLNEQNNLRKNTYLFHINQQLITLTNREIQCLYYLKEGLSAKRIARNMQISVRTVEIFCKNILGKTGYTSRLQLVSNLTNTTSQLINQLVVSL